MDEMKIEDAVYIEHLPTPNDILADINPDFKWEVYKAYPNLGYNYKQSAVLKNIFKDKKKYEAQPKDRLYFYPGCTVARYKVRVWGEKHKASVTILPEKATAKFVNDKCLDEFIKQRYFASVTKDTFIQWLKYNYNEKGILSDNVQSLHDIIIASEHDTVLLNHDYRYAAGNYISGNSDESDVKAVGFKKSVASFDGSAWSNYYNEHVSTPKEYALLETVKNDTNNYLQEDILDLISEDSVVIDQEMFDELDNLFKSHDNSNHVMAIEIICNCNIKKSLHLLMMLLSKYNGLIYNMKESKQVNFKGLLATLDMTNGSLSLSHDQMMDRLIDKKALTLPTLNEFAHAVKNDMKDSVDSKYFTITTIEVSDHVKSYFAQQEQIEEKEPELEEHD